MLQVKNINIKLFKNTLIKNLGDLCFVIITINRPYFVLQVLRHERCVKVHPYNGPNPDKIFELLNSAPLPSAAPVPARRGLGGGRTGPRVKKTPTAAEASVPDAESERRDLAFGKRVIAGKGTPVEILVTISLARYDPYNARLFVNVRLSTLALLSTARCTRLSSLTWQCWSTCYASSDVPSRDRSRHYHCLL